MRLQNLPLNASLEEASDAMKKAMEIAAITPTTMRRISDRTLKLMKLRRDLKFGLADAPNVGVEIAMGTKAQDLSLTKSLFVSYTV